MKTKKRIKIAFIIDQLAIGGTENQLLSTIRLLDKNKYELLLICLRDTEYYKRLKLDCKSYVIGLYSLFSFKGILKFFNFVFLLLKEKPIIAQTFFIDSNLIGIIAAKLAGVHNIIATRRDLGYWYKPALLKKIIIINKFADRFLVNSNAIKETIAKFERVPLEKIEVLYNGIDLKPFKAKYNTKLLRSELKIDNNNFVVGVVANLNREVKRIDIFIKAAAIVLKSIPNSTFLIIGEGYLKKELIALSNDLGIRQNVIFLGSKKTIYHYLSIFDVGTLTSDSEGFSNSILEYMAAGLPVVCSRTGGNVEIIKDEENGFTFEVGNYQELADKLILVLSNATIRERLGLANKQYILNYSTHFQISQLEKYYQNLVK